MSRAGAKTELLFYRFGGRFGAANDVGFVVFDEVSSVVAEVTLLLNTRSPFSASQEPGLMRRTVLGYGLADFSHYSPSSRQDALFLANFIRQTVTAYEPRLVVDNVTVDTPRLSRDCLSATISGYVRKRDRSTVPISFPVTVGAQA